jgi:hypothetical protein
MAVLSPWAGDSSTSSSPVATIATLGRAKTSNSAQPQLAATATSAAPITRPTGRRESPARASAPRGTTFSPARSIRPSSIVTEPSQTATTVCSTIATASAPSGSGAPVIISMASSCPTAVPCQTSPAFTDPATRSVRPNVRRAHGDIHRACCGGRAAGRGLRSTALASTRPVGLLQRHATPAPPARPHLAACRSTSASASANPSTRSAKDLSFAKSERARRICRALSMLYTLPSALLLARLVLGVNLLAEAGQHLAHARSALGSLGASSRNLL